MLHDLHMVHHTVKSEYIDVRIIRVKCNWLPPKKLIYLIVQSRNGLFRRKTERKCQSTKESHLGTITRCPLRSLVTHSISRTVSTSTWHPTSCCALLIREIWIFLSVGKCFLKSDVRLWSDRIRNYFDYGNNILCSM